MKRCLAEADRCKWEHLSAAKPCIIEFTAVPFQSGILWSALQLRTWVMAYLSVQPAAVFMVNVPLSQAVVIASSYCEP